MAAPQNHHPTDPALNSSALRISTEEGPFRSSTWGPQASAKFERTWEPKLQLEVTPLPAEEASFYLSCLCIILSSLNASH